MTRLIPLASGVQPVNVKSIAQAASRFKNVRVRGKTGLSTGQPTFIRFAARTKQPHTSVQRINLTRDVQYITCTVQVKPRVMSHDATM